MNLNISVEISIQEILCWFGLFLLAWNPNGAFNTLIESVGMKMPLFALASGAGSEWATKFLKKKGD